MKIIRVTYTVQPKYVEQNKQNIRQVMDDLRKLGDPNTKYASYLEEDGVTFMHFAQYPDEETSKILATLPSFSKFRKELKESQPVTRYIQGVNVKLIPYKKIVQSWRTDEFKEEETNSQIELSLVERDGRTELTILHTNLPKDGEHYKKGWEEHYFIPMKTYFS